jgi:hypothetical protein
MAFNFTVGAVAIVVAVILRRFPARASHK